MVRATAFPPRPGLILLLHAMCLLIRILVFYMITCMRCLGYNALIGQTKINPRKRRPFWLKQVAQGGSYLGGGFRHCLENSGQAALARLCGEYFLWKKTKDILLLLLCGLVCGGFFVGCILGMGACIHYFHSQTSIELSKHSFLILLAAVIVGTLRIIEKLYKYFTRNSKNPQITRYKDVSVVDEMSKNIPIRHFDK